MPNYKKRPVSSPPILPDAPAAAPRRQAAPDLGNAAAAQALAQPPAVGHAAGPALQAPEPEVELPILAALEAQHGPADDVAPAVPAATPYALAPGFLASLNNPELVERYRALEEVAPRVLDATANSPTLGTSVNEVKRGQVDGSTYFAKKGADAHELHREAMVPLMGHALGLRSMALSGLAVGGDQHGRVVTENTGGTSVKSLIERGTPEAMDQLAAADPAGIQQALLACMLFQEKDGHSDQFHVGPDGRFTKIDHGDMGLSAEDNRGAFTGASPREAPASSFAAAMPGAQDELTPEVLETIRGWDPAQFTAMQQAAVMGGDGGQALFDPETIARQTQNMALIQHLVNQADGRVSGAELFDRFGAAKYAMANQTPMGEAHPEVLARRAQTVEETGELAFPHGSEYHVVGRAGMANPAMDVPEQDVNVRHAARPGHQALAERSTERAKERERARVRDHYEEKKAGYTGISGFVRKKLAKRRRNQRLDAIDRS